MNKFTGTILTIPKMSGNVGAKTINIGGKGDDGATFIPSVSDSGIISWTNDKDLPNPEPVNIKGEKGGKGDPGKDGVTPEFSIGTVETLDPGSDAVVTLGGTAERPILNFGIPRGDNAVISPDQGGDVSPEGGGYLVQWNSIVGKPDYLTEAGINNLIDEKLDDSGGAAIIDVVKLPTEDIREDCFYRLLSGSLVFDQFVQNMYTIHCVETLPETGLPATNLDQTEGHVYYTVSDGEIWGYVDEILSYGLGVPAGWYPGATLLGALGFGYSGVITNILDDPIDGTFRLLLEYVVYDYKNGNWTSHKKIGWEGTGMSAEIFNHPSNVASGHASHAEGYASHAEGDASHAEGYASHAEGYASHAEGYTSHASGRSQHVQGEFNIVDPERDPEQPNARAKYAHIVGNGTSEGDRSNAHTLDWSGNAWFQGSVYVGGIGQDDEAAVKLATVDDVQNLIDTKLGVIENGSY